jgi:hypothetical protein
LAIQPYHRQSKLSIILSFWSANLQRLVSYSAAT